MAVSGARCRHEQIRNLLPRPPSDPGGGGDLGLGSVTTLFEAYEQANLPQPKKQQGEPEHSLQVHLKVLCRECVATPHMFAAHDRSKKQHFSQHMREKARGLRKGWPDIEIPLLGGLTFRCELKAAGEKVADNSEQAAVIRELNNLGHPTAWANSAVMFVREARRCGVPFRVGVDARAAAIDASLAEWARLRALGALPKKKRASKPRESMANPGRASRALYGR